MHRTALFIGCLWSACFQFGAQGGFAHAQQEPISVVVVTVPSAQIKLEENGSIQVIGNAALDTRLWAVDGKEGQTLVIDPASSQQGWVSNGAIRIVQASASDLAAAQSQFNQAIANANAGNFRQAQKNFEETIAIFERSVGQEHPRIPSVLQLTAQMHNRLREFAKAEACLTKALTLNRKYAGTGHPSTIKCLSEFAQCYEIQLRVDKACEMYRQAAEASEKAFGRKHPQTASMLVQLANTLFDDSQYAEAEQNYLEAWNIRKQILGVDHESTQSAAGGLGRVYYSIGRPAKAVEILEQCRISLRKKYGRVPAGQSFILTYLGFAYQSLAEYDRAKECLAQIYKNDCETKGTQSKEALNSLHNLATLAHLNNDEQAAEGLFLQCLEGRIRVLGEEHQQTLSTLWSLGNLYLENGNYEKAETFLVRTLRLAEQTGDVNHDSPYHLGKLYSDTGRHQFAEKLIQNAIKQEAERKRTVDGHMLTALSEVQVRMGLIDKAIATQDQARRRVTEHLKHVLRGMPKARRELFLARGFASGLNTAFSIALSRADDPKVAATSAEWLLNGKVIGQEITAEASLLASPDAAPLMAELRSVRDQLAEIVVQENARDQITKERFAKLETRQKILELKVTDFGTGRFAEQSWHTVDQLRTRLPSDSRFISIAKIQIRDFAKSQETSKWKGARYVAWVVSPQGGSDTKLVDLGDAKSIDADVDRLRKEVTGDMLSRINSTGEVATEKRYRQFAVPLSAKILRPLEKHLGEAKEIILSPDGELWRVPWEALVLSNDEYLIQSYQLRYILSGRDLKPAREAPVQTSAPVIFASPNYDLEKPGTADNTVQGRPRTGSIYFSPLPGTAVEARNIKPSIEEFAKQPTRLLLENEAEESEFKQLKCPRVLVLSTHGYYLPDRPRNPGSRKPSTSPLLRCGLALAGSNHPFSVGRSANDGILTGLEIVGSDLKGTELVVLSACETGLGEVRNGEGVAGLRQAFQLAGAASVVSSLWQVSDQETVELMNLFFQNIANGKSKSEAMRNAQLARIEDRNKRYGAAHPFYWAAFTLTGKD